MSLIGCCAGVNELERMILLKELGYDYVELSVAGVSEMEEADYEKLKADIAARGIKCRCCNSFIPGSYRLTGDEADHAAAMSYVEKALRRVSGLGVEIVVFGSGAARRVPEGFDKGKAWEQFVSFARLVSDEAKSTGILIAIEPLNVNECNLITSVALGVKMVRDIGRDNIRLLADYYHMAVNGEDMSAIYDGGDMFIHTHFADPDGRVFPLMDKAQYADFFDSLMKIGYSGGLSIEAGTDNFDEDAKTALEFLRSKR